MNPIQDLIKIMAALRDPETGCPWDRQQTMETIIPYTLEEIYELVDAIERNSMEDIRDELGDLLFHIIFYSHMAAEAGGFDFSDVVSGVCEKLTRRHPHVFAGQRVDTVEEVKRNWEKMKRDENRGDYLGNIARALPALQRAEKLQKRAARAGFDWDDPAPVLAKVEEEINELKQGMSDSKNRARLQSELGDVLFAAVNLARHLQVNPETALRGANERFEQRFRFIQARLEEEGEDLESASLERMDELWEEAKIKFHNSEADRLG